MALLQTSSSRIRRVLSRCRPPAVPSPLVVGFDDDHAVANAGLLLPATLAERLGIEAVVDMRVTDGTSGSHWS